MFYHVALANGYIRFQTDKKIWKDTEAAATGNLDELRKIHRNGYSFDKKVVDAAIEAGKIDCLTFLIEEAEVEGFMLRHDMFRRAVMSGNQQIIEYFWKKGWALTSPDIENAVKACNYELLRCMMKFQDSTIAVDLAAKTGNILVLEFLDELGCKSPNAIAAAAENGQAETIRWLAEKKWHNPAVRNFCNVANVECLTECEKAGFNMKTRDVLISAVKLRRNECVRWFCQNSSLVDEAIVEEAIGRCHDTFLIVFNAFGQPPKQEWLRIAVKHDDLVIVKFLIGQGLQVTDVAVNLALSRGSKNIIDELVFNWTRASRKAITKHAVRFSKKGDFRWLNNTIFMRALLAVPQNQMKKILVPHLDEYRINLRTKLVASVGNSLMPFLVEEICRWI